MSEQSHRHPYDWLPSEREALHLEKLARRVVDQATKKDDFEARGSFFDMAVLQQTPLTERQAAIDRLARMAGIELQTYRMYSYAGDSAREFTPLLAHVVTRGGETVQEPLVADGRIRDVYPPADESDDSFGES